MSLWKGKHGRYGCRASRLVAIIDGNIVRVFSLQRWHRKHLLLVSRQLCRVPHFIIGPYAPQTLLNTSTRFQRMNKNILSPQNQFVPTSWTMPWICFLFRRWNRPMPRLADLSLAKKTEGGDWEWLNPLRGLLFLLPEAMFCLLGVGPIHSELLSREYSLKETDETCLRSY